MPTALVVKTPVFEGPLELLLELIEKRKLLINDISLSSVTDDYLKSVNAMGELPLAEASDFVALAATLLLIKSRSLLPSLELTDDEARDIKELEFRLALFQLIKEAARGLGRGLDGAPLWPQTPLPPDVLFVPDKKATPGELMAAARRLIDEFPAAAALPKVAVEKAISLEEMIDRLAHRVSAAMQLSFREFSGHGKPGAAKRDIVVSFLALLELVKQGIIRATQNEPFSDITLEGSSVSTPSYE